ncbi:MAG: hypothetical protein J3R72DRAFT_502385 [Linnemannia gamsii]|nr:MAG: hypothetical protein J3R72DRAFT_502385 [Linnemannia gamsii]
MKRASVIFVLVSLAGLLWTAQSLPVVTPDTAAAGAASPSSELHLQQEPPSLLGTILGSQSLSTDNNNAAQIHGNEAALQPLTTVIKINAGIPLPPTPQQ